MQFKNGVGIRLVATKVEPILLKVNFRFLGGSVEMADLEGEQRRFLRRASFAVEGMHCVACSNAVEETLRRVQGVAAAQASALKHVAEATYDPRTAQLESLRSALSNAGFPAQVTEDVPLQPDTIVSKFRVEAMTCSTCSGAVESALAATQGVKHASVSLTLQEAKVEYDPELTDEVRNNSQN